MEQQGERVSGHERSPTGQLKMTSLLLFSKRTPADTRFAELDSDDRFKLICIKRQAAQYDHKF